jgi:hypothetical protein
LHFLTGHLHDITKNNPTSQLTPLPLFLGSK